MGFFVPPESDGPIGAPTCSAARTNGPPKTGRVAVYKEIIDSNERNMPWAVASPATTDEVAQCMRLAAEAGIPVASGSFQAMPGTPTYSSISPWWLAGSGVLR